MLDLHKVFPHQTLVPLPHACESTPFACCFQILRESAWYGMFGDAHNIIANPETHYVYAVGINKRDGGKEQCKGSYPPKQ